MQTVLAKAVYDNIADSTDELTFRKGDVITVLEKDIDGLFGWWLCSLHGRQGIAPGNRLKEITAEPTPAKSPAVSQQSLLEDLDYAVPKPFEDPGEDYDIPRSVLSPQDYDFPKADEKFDFKPVENGTDEKITTKNNDNNIYQEIYDVPSVPCPQKPPTKKKYVGQTVTQTKGAKSETSSGETMQGIEIGSVIHTPSEQAHKTSLPKTHPKPPRASKINVGKGKAPPPARPPKPATKTATAPPREDSKSKEQPQDESIYCVPSNQEIYEVPKQAAPEVQMPSKTETPSDKKIVENKVGVPKQEVGKAMDVVTTKSQESSQVSTPSSSTSETKRTQVSDSRPKDLPEDIYDTPSADVTPGDIYDVPPALKGYQDGEIYDTPPRKPTGSLERNTYPGSPPEMKTGSNERMGQTPGKSIDFNHNKRTEKPLEGPWSLVKSNSGSLGRSSDGSLKRSSGESKRSSDSSTGSGKHSSDSDDYVDYQEIYGDGHEKHVNIYDVPVQPVQVSDIETAPIEKKTTASILQRINMAAVKGLKLEPAAALQRLSKLEQAVDVTVTKLLSFVTSKWRDPVLLRPNLADIRDIAGKGKVALRLLTEFGLSTLVNARGLANEELSGRLSRAIEPLLETYYSLKLALQRLDNTDWKSPIERLDSGHDDLDLIMVYIRGVPEDSRKLVGIVRTTATTLFSRPRKPPVPVPAKEQKVASKNEVQPTTGDFPAKNESKDGGARPQTKPKPVMNGKEGKMLDNKATDVKDIKMPSHIEGEIQAISKSNGKVAEVVAKVEKFGLVSMKADSESIDSTTMMVGLIKESVNENIKPTGRKYSPGTVRRLCGMASPHKGEEASDDTIKPALERRSSDPDGVPQLPPRRPSNATKVAPPPPKRKDSGEWLQHVRNKSLERFVPDVDPSQLVNGSPNAPPKPKLDRHKTMRKSYKYPMRHEKVTLREHKVTEPRSPTQGNRKCNSDPTDLEITPEVEETDAKQNRASDSMDGKVPENSIANTTHSVHISDSDLPSGLGGRSDAHPLLSPKLNSPPMKPMVQRSKSFSRTKPSSTKTTMGHATGFGDFILSFSDKELLEFYKYEIDAQLFVLNEAMKGLFTSVESGQPPKTFVSNSKFVVLGAHKFIYIGDTLQRKICHEKLGTDITSATAKLSESVKTLVHATKMAALQYPAINPMRELTTAAAQVSEASIVLHKVVKAGKS